MISISGQRICRLSKEAAHAQDGVAALGMIGLLREELEEFERQQAARALAGGHSYSDVARALGISRQAAHRRFRHIAAGVEPDEQLLASAAVREVIGQASAEARELGASTVETRHLLLAILHCDPHTARIVAIAGMTLEDARREAGALAGAGIRHVLARAVAIARRDRADEVEVEHVLRAVLETLDRRRLGAGARRLLQTLDEPAVA